MNFFFGHVHDEYVRTFYFNLKEKYYYIDIKVKRLTLDYAPLM